MFVIVGVIISNRMRSARHVARVGETSGACRGLVGNLRRRDDLEDLVVDERISKWIFKKWDWGGGVDWVDLAQNRDKLCALVNTVMFLPSTWSAWNFLTSWETIRFSESNLLHGVCFTVLDSDHGWTFCLKSTILWDPVTSPFLVTLTALST